MWGTPSLAATRRTRLRCVWPGGVGDDAGPPGDQRHEGVGVVGVDAEVVGRPGAADAADPGLVVAHHHHRSVGAGRQVVQPGQLLGRDPPGRLPRDDRVQQGQADAGQVDHAVAGVDRLAAVGVVVAPDDVQPVAERRAVAGVERRELVVHPVRGQVALGDHGRRLDGRDLRRRATVHRLGVGRLAGLDALDGTELAVVHAARLDLAEVHVVHGGEAAQQLAAGAGQRVDRHAVQLVVGVRGQPVVAVARSPSCSTTRSSATVVTSTRRTVAAIRAPWARGPAAPSSPAMERTVRAHGAALSGRPRWRSAATRAGGGGPTPAGPPPAAEPPRARRLAASRGPRPPAGARARRWRRRWPPPPPPSGPGGSTRARCAGRRRRARPRRDRPRLHHRGMFPCLRRGSSSRFVLSMARPAMSLLRVSAGSMTSST